jgi:hypothetical protein
MPPDLPKASTGWSADLKIRLPKEFQTDPFREKIIEIQKRHGRQKKNHFDDIGPVGPGKASEGGKDPLGLPDHPHERDGTPIRRKNLKASPDRSKSHIEKRVQDFQEEIQTVMREVNRINHAQQKEIQQLADELTRFVVCKAALTFFVRTMQDQARNSPFPG